MKSNSKNTKAQAMYSVTSPKTFTGTASGNYRTHEGAQTYSVSPLETLRRTVLSCMLYENTFYESGSSIAARIESLVGEIDPTDVSITAIEARTHMKLRHVPLFLAVQMLKYPEHKKLVRRLIPQIVNRADECAELISMYWKDNLKIARDTEGQYTSQRAKKKLPMQLIRGIRDAISKFDDYQITKYLGKGNPVSMADVIRMVHPDPVEAQNKLHPNKRQTVNMADVYKSVVNGTATAPVDTWEVALSAAGKLSKREVFSDLLEREKLPAMALLRNLRGMIESGVSTSLIRHGLENINPERVLPYRFITARKYAPDFSKELESAMFKCVANIEKLDGHTIVLVDVSGSMSMSLSGKSEMNRAQAAGGLAILAKEICSSCDIMVFDHTTVKLPDCRGFELADNIQRRVGGGTDISQAVSKANKNKYDRLILFTDEQSATHASAPKGLGYIINVASYEHGVGYGDWHHINGFSEATLAYIAEYEREVSK